MSKCPRVRMGLTILFVGLSSAAARAEDPVKPADALAAFQKAWAPLVGKAYMRPPDDGGWKARIEALRGLARAGDQATPVLVEALSKGTNDTRVFAAQALALLPSEGARGALVAALKDAHPAVRLHALGALSGLGKVPKAEPYLTLQKKDPNRDVRANAGFAMERDDKPAPEAIRKALADYDPKQIASATVGKKAPDFTLTSADGKKIRLSDFQGKKAVVLVFIYGDT